MLRNLSTQKFYCLQVFCKLQKRPANYRTAFTRQRSLVRNQHRPLCKSIPLRLVPRDRPAPALATLSRQLGFPRECLPSTVPISDATRGDNPRDRRASTPALAERNPRAGRQIPREGDLRGGPNSAPAARNQRGTARALGHIDAIRHTAAALTGGAANSTLRRPGSWPSDL
jgi:hypothetical protein